MSEFGLKKYKTRPATVEAMLFEGGSGETHSVYQWIEDNTQGSFDVNNKEIPPPASGVSIDAATGCMVISTLGAVRSVNLGDYVVRGINGEFFPMDPEKFRATFKPLSEKEVSRTGTSDPRNRRRDDRRGVPGQPEPEDRRRDLRRTDV